MKSSKDKPLRIAIADDEPDMREYFEKLLPRLGHEVIAAAENGRDLIDQCRLHQPDLVISDVVMPVMNGIDAALQIYRERPIPVILISACHEQPPARRAENDHIMGYLDKPLKQGELQSAIAAALRRFKKLQAATQGKTPPPGSFQSDDTRPDG